MKPTTNEICALLQSISDQSPSPWYPKQFALDHQLERSSLDNPLNELRMLDYIRLTDWEKGVGQGYILTEFGRECLADPQFLAKLKSIIEKKSTTNPKTQIPQEGNSDDPERKTSTPKEFKEVPLRELTELEKGDRIRNALLMGGTIQITKVLIVLNLIGFVFSIGMAIYLRESVIDLIVNGNTTVMEKSGGLTAISIADEETWRMLSSCFLHFGLFHLAINLYSLLAIGRKLEPLWGSTGYLIIYLFSGIGSCVSIMLFSPGVPPTAYTVSAGASGAIWGLMTSVVVWLYRYRRYLPEKMVVNFLRQWSIIILVNFFIGFLPHVSMSGHLGGGVTGILVSLLIFYCADTNKWLQSGSIIALALFPMVAISTMYLGLYTNPEWKPLIAPIVERQFDSNKNPF